MPWSSCTEYLVHGKMLKLAVVEKCRTRSACASTRAILITLNSHNLVEYYVNVYTC